MVDRGGHTLIHVVIKRSDTEALCGFPRERMAWQPATLRGFAATCGACNEQKRILRGEVEYPARVGGKQ